MSTKSSYPYLHEGNTRAKRHCVGLAIPHLAAEIPAMLRQLLGLAPSTKVVYSSDASQIPELFWLAARWGRRGLAAVLDELIALGALEVPLPPRGPHSERRQPRPSTCPRVPPFSA